LDQHDKIRRDAMTITADRRALLKAGAAVLGATALPDGARAQAAPARNGAYEFMVKDLVYSKSGGKERLARAYQPAGNGPCPAGPQGAGGGREKKGPPRGPEHPPRPLPPGPVGPGRPLRHAAEAPHPGCST